MDGTQFPKHACRFDRFLPMNEWNTFLLDLYDSAQLGSPAEFAAEALNAGRRFVAFDAAAIVDFSLSPTGRLDIKNLHLENVPVERLISRTALFGSERVESDGVLRSGDETLKKAFNHRGRSVTAAYDIDAQDLSLRKYCRTYEVGQSLAFVSPTTRSGTVPALALWRSDPKKNYAKADVHIADLLLPHVFQARELNKRLLSQACIQPQEILLIADFDGRLHFSDDCAIALLQLEWPQWHPPLLSRDLLEAFRSDINRPYIGRAISVQARVEGDLLWLLVKRSAPLNLLSEAELRVARLAADGAQYKEIARDLGISPATVRNQLHAVYRKLNVKNKTALGLALRK